MMCGKRNDCSETLWKDDWYARIEMNTSTAEIWISNLEKYRIFSPVQNIFTPTPASLSETDILAIYGCKAASSICGRSKNKNLGLVLPSSWWDHSLRFPYEPALKWTWRSNIFSHTGRLGSLILCSSSSNHIVTECGNQNDITPPHREDSVLMISQLGWLSPGVSSGGFSHEMKPRLSFSAGNPNSDGGDQWLCSW